MAALDETTMKRDSLLGADQVEDAAAGQQHGPDRIRGVAMPAIIARLSGEERDRLERHLMRKIDFRLLPMIMCMYILNFIDRNNIAAARLAGLEEDLNLNASGTQFSTAVSIFFVGYILMQVPSNMVLNKTGKPGIYLPACMAVWGAISATTAAMHSFGGLLACRFCLGFVEAAYFPGCLYYLSCWYTRKELGVRTTYMYIGSPISGAFSGLIAAGITGSLDGARGLRAWRWLFLIEGAVTVAVAMAAVFVLPNFPRTTPWLSEQEVAMAVWRLEHDIGQDDWVSSEEQAFFQGFKAAVKDVKTWVLLILFFGIVSAASVSSFFPTVVSTLNYSRVKTLLLTAPPYVLGVFTTLLNAWHADRTGERFWHISLPLCLAMVTFIIAASTTNTAARYIPGLCTGSTTAFAWISNTMPRPPAKRAAALAFINAASNIPSIYTSYLYPSKAAPQYEAAFIHSCLMAAMSIVAAGVLRIILARLNKRLDSGKHVEGAVNAAPGEAVEHGFRFLL